MNYGPALDVWRCRACSYPLGDIHSGPALLIGGREVLAISLRCPKCGVVRRWRANDKPSQSDQNIDKATTERVQCDIR